MYWCAIWLNSPLQLVQHFLTIQEEIALSSKDVSLHFYVQNEPDAVLKMQFKPIWEA